MRSVQGMGEINVVNNGGRAVCDPSGVQDDLTESVFSLNG